MEEFLREAEAKLAAQLRRELRDPLPASRWGDGLATMACIAVLWAHSGISWWAFTACFIGGTLVNLWRRRWLKREIRQLERTTP